MNDLPYIDEHSVRLRKPAAATWSALLRVLAELMGSSQRFARLVGCDPSALSPAFEGRAGETLPGFRVVDAEPGRLLVLRGRHHFSDYALTFIIDGEHLRAESRASFPGITGWLYRTAVIGSGAHRIVTRRMLRQIVDAA